MQHIQDTNFYCIHGWMLRLGLVSNELPVYAIIYGFSQDGKTEFSGSLNYLAEFANCTQRTVQTTLKNLETKGMITKRSYVENNIKRVFYKAVVPSEIFSMVEKNFLGGIENISMGYRKNFVGGIENISTNNIDIYNRDNIEDNKECSKKPKRTRKKQDAPKIDYASSVRLTEDEYEEFIAKYGKDMTLALIEILNNYKEQYHRKYDSDAAAIRNWVVDAYYERANKAAKRGSIGVAEAAAEVEKRLGVNNGNDNNASSSDPVWGVWAE